MKNTSILKLSDFVKFSTFMMSLACLQPAEASALDRISKEAENCLSKCVFEETKPPPLGSNSVRLLVQRSRNEILEDCKSQCKVVQAIDRAQNNNND